jgi:hypothetical protein
MVSMQVNIKLQRDLIVTKYLIKQLLFVEKQFFGEPKLLEGDYSDLYKTDSIPVNNIFMQFFKIILFSRIFLLARYYN